MAVTGGRGDALHCTLYHPECVLQSRDGDADAFRVWRLTLCGETARKSRQRLRNLFRVVGTLICVIARALCARSNLLLRIGRLLTPSAACRSGVHAFLTRSHGEHGEKRCAPRLCHCEGALRPKQSPPSAACRSGVHAFLTRSHGERGENVVFPVCVIARALCARSNLFLRIGRLLTPSGHRSPPSAACNDKGVDTGRGDYPATKVTATLAKLPFGEWKSNPCRQVLQSLLQSSPSIPANLWTVLAERLPPEKVSEEIAP